MDSDAKRLFDSSGAATDALDPEDPNVKTFIGNIQVPNKAQSQATTSTPPTTTSTPPKAQSQAITSTPPDNLIADTYTAPMATSPTTPLSQDDMFRQFLIKNNPNKDPNKIMGADIGTLKSYNPNGASAFYGAPPPVVAKNNILNNPMFNPVSADAAAYAAPAAASLDAKTPSPYDKIPGQTTLYAGPTGTYSIPKDEPPQEGTAQSERVFGPWNTYEAPNKTGGDSNGKPQGGYDGASVFSGGDVRTGPTPGTNATPPGNPYPSHGWDIDESDTGGTNPGEEPGKGGFEMAPKFLPFLQKSAHMLGQGGEIMSRLISHSTIPTRSDVMQEQNYNADQAQRNRQQQLDMLQHDNEYNQARMKLDNQYKTGQIDEKGYQDRLEQETIGEQARQTFRANLYGNMQLTAAGKGPGGIPTTQGSIH